MGQTIVHRGPDDGGVWMDEDAGVGLVHRRLSILDLSPLGHQPMHSHAGRFVIAYNGEVYNFPELRAELEAHGCRFNSHSDTEVILEGCATWGVAQTVRKLNGMFAFALWDRVDRVLWLARDRLGIKPLYWGWFDGLLVFGSELKALKAHGGWDAAIDREAVCAFMRHGYVPAPRSIWRGVNKLAPGTLLIARAGAAPVEECYWSAEEVARQGIAARAGHGVTRSEAVDQLDQLLRDAVGRQMVADVPLGAFLSGGYDSSVVAALMQAQSSQPVKTFSIGFSEQGYDEAPHAKAVAAHLGTDHTELYVQPEHALEVVPRLPRWYDEPFADSSQIPTFLVSEMTRGHVTVALSGDGGDELFAGYNRYRLASRIWKYLSPVPRPLRRGIGDLLRRVAPSRWDSLLAPIGLARAGDKLHKLADVLADSNDALYRRLVSQWPMPERVVQQVCEPAGILADPSLPCRIPDFLDRMQYCDLVTYLPDDILTKVDRASMAVSLEVRVPLLDHRVVEYAWTLPQSLKLRGRDSKWLLRQVLYRYVPRQLLERPKMGFGVPLDSWLRGPLRDWAESLLDANVLRQQGFLDPAPVRAAWADHLSGRRNLQYPLWTVLMFQAWLETQG